MTIKIYWGEIMRELRLEYNLTQQEVAGVLHISRQTYSGLECGRTQPTVEILAILSNIYDIDIYSYAVNRMPDDMVAEQKDFKSTMPSSNKNKDKDKKRKKTSKYF